LQRADERHKCHEVFKDTTGVDGAAGEGEGEGQLGEAEYSQAGH